MQGRRRKKEREDCWWEVAAVNPGVHCQGTSERMGVVKDQKLNCQSITPLPPTHTFSFQVWEYCNRFQRLVHITINVFLEGGYLFDWCKLE
jgi:hypothetical protein